MTRPTCGSCRHFDKGYCLKLGVHVLPTTLACLHYAPRGA